MQKLFVKVRDPITGTTSQKEVKVFRSWSDSSGQHLFLHHNGVYGDKAGNPVCSEDELSVIVSPNHHTQAMAWWNRVGHAMSEKYYADQQAVLDELSSHGIPDMAESGMDVDTVLYIRRPVKVMRRDAYSEPTMWPVWFNLGRPDWWGHAHVIEIDGFRYQRVDIKEPDEADAGPAETKPDDTDPVTDGEKEIADLEKRAGAAAAADTSEETFDTGPGE